MRGAVGLLFLVLFVPVFSQETSHKEWHVQAVLGKGALLPEYSYVNAFGHQALTQVEISVYTQTKGNSIWQQLYRYPRLGLSAQYTSLGNDSLFGHEFAFYPFVSLTAVEGKRLSWNHVLGLGIGFATRIFDLDHNPLNVAVGSHLNLHFMYRTELDFQFSDRAGMTAGLGFHHFSNANMKEPNLGLNMVYLNLGYHHRINDKSPLIVQEIPRHKPSNEYALVLGLGGKHTRALQSDIFFTMSLSGEYRWRWKQRFRIGGGIDLFYDSATKTEMKAPGSKAYKAIYDFRSGVHFSQEFVYNRFSFILQEGIYLLLTDHVDHAFMYNRAILRYKWGQHFFTHISMKSHLHILDYPEFGFAYYL